jgi:hypothetical protein
MTSNEPDIHRVWAAMLDDPAPPLPTAAETLSAARGSARRTVFALAAAGAAGAVVIATVGVGLALGGGHRAAPAPIAPAASRPAAPSPSRPPVPPPPAPGQEAADKHGKQTAALLMGTVPAGLTGLVQEASPGSPAWTWQFGYTSEYASTVYVVLTTGQADGELSASIRGGMSDLGTDLCSPKVTKLETPAGTTGCDVVDVDGVAIRVAVTHNERGEVITAIRMLAGGLLVVQSQQGIEPHQADGNPPPDAKTGTRNRQHSMLGGWPALPAPPLTTEQVAALAANRGLLP